MRQLVRETLARRDRDNDLSSVGMWMKLLSLIIGTLVGLEATCAAAVGALIDLI